MKTSTQKRARKTQRQLAREYRVDERTILRWKDNGAPLHDAEAMEEWMEDRRRGTRHAVDPELLPHGLEHSNVLRMVAESAAMNFCYEATSVLVANLIEDLIKTQGMDSQKASGTGIMVWYGMLYQLKHWVMGDRYDATLWTNSGSSLDSQQRALLPGWKGISKPPRKFPRQQIPESVREALVAVGLKPRKYADISGDEGGFAMSDEE